MACVKKRRNRWVVDYRDTYGRRRWETVDGDREDAERRMAEIIGTGKVAIDKKTTMREYAERWLNNEAKSRLKTSTYLEYKRAIDRHLVPFFGSTRFYKLKRTNVIQFIAKKKEEGLIRSLKVLIAPLRSMYYDAIENGNITSNPAIRLGKYLKDETVIKKPKPLNRDEIAHLLETVRTRMPEWYPLFLTFARSGLRIGELIALQWDSVDFHGRFIEVTRGWSRGALTTPKNNKTRQVDMSNQLTECLHSLLLKRKKEALSKGTEISPFVFLTPRGLRVDGDNFRKITFKRALSLAELRHVHPHLFRHSFGSLLLEQGADLNFVKDQLGHHSIILTVDTYGHRMTDDRRLVNSLDDPATKNEGGKPERQKTG